MVAAPLVWLGQADRLRVRKDVITDDPVREARAAVIAAWQERFKIDTEVTVKDIMHFNAEDVKSALMDIEGGGKSSNAIAYKLKSFEGVIINGMYIEKRPGEHNTRTASDSAAARQAGHADQAVRPAAGIRERLCDLRRRCDACRRFRIWTSSMADPRSDVCYAPESGAKADIAGGPGSGHKATSAISRHSISCCRFGLFLNSMRDGTFRRRICATGATSPVPNGRSPLIVTRSIMRRCG